MMLNRNRFNRVTHCQPVVIFALCLAGLPSLTLAADAANPIGAGQLVTTALSLVFVIGAIMALAWLFSRMQNGRSGSAGIIRVVATQPIGAKERILVVDVAGQQMVLGMTSSGIRKLCDLSEPVDVKTPIEVGERFAARLKTALQGGAR